MLRRLFRYILVATVPLLTGCSDDFSEDAANGGGVLSISLKSNNSTRADSESDDSGYNEDRIENVVLAFYPNEYGDETPALAVYKPGDLTLNGTNATTDVTMRLTPDMLRTLFGDTNGASCKFFAIANLSDSEIAGISGNPTVSSLKKMNIGSEFETKKRQDSFVMSGTGSVTYTKVNEREKSASGSGTLTRTASRISLSINIDSSVTDSEGNRWTPVTTAGNIRVLLNEGVSASLLSSDGNQDNNTYYNTKLSQSAVVRNMTYTGNTTYPYTIDVPLYTYPNVWDNNSIDEQHRTSMTLVMTWQRGANTFRTFYYQVPVTPSESLVSNHSYQVNLRVGMLGSLTPDTPVEIEDVSYQVVDWGNAPVDVNLSDTRYLIVNPSSYKINNEGSFRIPFYSSHEVEISDISMTFQRFNFYNNTLGQVVEIQLTKNVIDNSNSRAASGEEFCTYDIEYDSTSKQYYIVINHPLKIWNPYASNGQEVALTGNATSITPESASNRISYMTASDDDSFAPYTINVTLRHKDNASFVETADIVQYPGMYITPEANPGGSYNSRYIKSFTGNVGNNSTSVNAPSSATFYYGLINYGYTYVNPSISTQRFNRVSTDYIVNDERLGGLSMSSSKNPNMYIITTTQLNSNSSYIIGDPRSKVIDNDLSGDKVGEKEYKSEAESWCNKTTALYEPGSAARGLLYYYPTLETSATENMIAPKFRIASQYGALGKFNPDNQVNEGSNNYTHLTLKQGRQRMATYQEQGCPAGRWRLPTKAELEYMVKLQEKKFIPTLFKESDSGTGYLTAQGPFRIVSGKLVATDVGITKHYVRGIYDEWYWEQQTDYVLQKDANGVYNYTFGDIPRQQ